MMRRECDAFRRLLPAVAANDASDVELSRVESHTTSCEACCQELRELRAAWEQLRGWEIPEDSLHAARVGLEARLDEPAETETLSPLMRRVMPMIPWAVAAGLLLGVRFLWGAIGGGDVLELSEWDAQAVVQRVLDSIPEDVVELKMPGAFSDG